MNKFDVALSDTITKAMIDINIPGPEPTLPVDEVLARAADWIKKEGWTKQAYFRKIEKKRAVPVPAGFVKLPEPGESIKTILERISYETIVEHSQCSVGAIVRALGMTPSEFSGLSQMNTYTTSPAVRAFCDYLISEYPDELQAEMNKHNEENQPRIRLTMARLKEDPASTIAFWNDHMAKSPEQVMLDMQRCGEKWRANQ